MQNCREEHEMSTDNRNNKKHMKLTSKMTQCLFASIITAIHCGSALNIQASGKAADPTTAPSTGGLGGSGGAAAGGNSKAPSKTTPTSPAPAPKPAPIPVVAAPLTFVCTPDASGNVPVCTGAYQIDPYYPTLSLLTVNVSASSVNVPDGTVLYVTVNLVGYGYGLSAPYIIIAGQLGFATMSGYVIPGTTVQSVVITDASGNVIAAGN
jgi:hypothetical protein